MKTVILAGGLGTRIAEPGQNIPKPMVEIGGMPIIHHIMSFYASRGHSDFVLALGHRSQVVKSYFLNLRSRIEDIQISLGTGETAYLTSKSEGWNVTLVDTGAATMTGGRLLRLREYLPDTFFMTYGDGLSDVDLSELLECHKANSNVLTLTAVNPDSRYGQLVLDAAGRVEGFREKPEILNEWVNGGFMVAEPAVFDYLDGDETVLEAGPMARIAEDGRLGALRHQGFWHAMDTMRDRESLEQIWATGMAPWKTLG